LAGFFRFRPPLAGPFLRPHGAGTQGNTMRKLRELLEWIFIALDLYGLIEMLIDFIKQLF
jgi:hypothetical protein